MMNHKCIPIVIACFLAGLSARTFADNVPFDRSIDRIAVYDDFAAVKYSPAYVNDLSCSGGKTAELWAVIEWETDADRKALLATLLAAQVLQASGATVGFGIHGCFDRFGGGVPKIFRVDVIPP